MSKGKPSPSGKAGRAGEGKPSPSGKQSKSGARTAPDWRLRPLSRDDFISLIREKGEELYRDLSWRNIDDAYGVLVSEVMLQQTQVARVERYWPRWMSLFPTIDALAAADQASVLDAWQGLGYNRRALALKRACETCSAERGGELPRSVDELVKLPGIGPATAAGVMAFAYDEPAVYIETNVRSVFLHELFPDQDEVTDKELAPYVVDSCPQTDVRGWYYALLDYGAFLKKQVANPSRRSKHYARQGKFEGSRREKRSMLLREVLACPDGIDVEALARRLDEYEQAAQRPPVERDVFESLLSDLLAEGFFRRDSDTIFP